MYAIRLDSHYIYVNRILQFVDDWKYEFCLTSRKQIHRKPLENDNPIVRWTYKNCDKIEFYIKNYSQELKELLVKELKKVKCSAKITFMSNTEYKLVVKIKKLPSCDIL